MLEAVQLDETAKHGHSLQFHGTSASSMIQMLRMPRDAEHAIKCTLQSCLARVKVEARQAIKSLGAWKSLAFASVTC